MPVFKNNNFRSDLCVNLFAPMNITYYHISFISEIIITNNENFHAKNIYKASYLTKGHPILNDHAKLYSHQTMLVPVPCNR